MTAEGVIAVVAGLLAEGLTKRLAKRPSAVAKRHRHQQDNRSSHKEGRDY
jgi:hypothetical protein